MKKTRILGALALTAAAALTLSACGGGTGGAGEHIPAPSENVVLEGSPTFDRIESRGKVIVGVKEDQPGLGFVDAATGERSGFDVDIARWIAASLGFGEDDIEYKQIASANREQAIVNGEIDYYVGTYSITDSRKEQIDFAGPYFLTGQGLLVRSDSDIASDKDLAGVTVCSATGSTPIQNIRTNYPEAKPIEYDTYSLCVDNLKQNQVDAVTTDESILLGYAAEDPDNIKVVGETFSEEKYGIGLPKGDDALRAFINDQLESGGTTWKAIYDANLGDAGVDGTQPAVDRY